MVKVLLGLPITVQNDFIAPISVHGFTIKGEKSQEEKKKVFIPSLERQ